VLDLYNVPDPQKYLNPLEARVQDADISEPLVDYYKTGKNKVDKIFDLANDDDDDDLVDDSDEEDARNSI
jgi:hypothetical protein